MATKQLAHSTADNDLKTVLSALETRLATPLMPGELADWLAVVAESWGTAKQQIQHHSKTEHPSQFQQIGSADPELLPRVEQLQAEDAAIEQDCQSLDHLVSRIASHAPKLQPDEEKARHHVKKLVDVGIAFVTRVRKQEVALQTWFVEAFNRDRGAVD
jgi:hypothetical protein